MNRHLAQIVFVIVAGAGAAGCLGPTEAVVDISTDAVCSSVAGTGIAAGKPGAVETRPFDTTTTQCTGAGEIGSIVLLPDDDRQGAFAFKAVTSFGLTPVDDCLPPDYGPSCVVARRSLHFVPHHPLHIPLSMNLACAGVSCPEGQTCADGSCVTEACDDPNGCDTGPVLPWEKQFGGPGSQMARAVTRSSTNFVAVTGNFSGPIDFGHGPLTPKGKNDIFVATYTQTGLIRWATAFGGAGEDAGISVTTALNGDVYVLASFEGEVDFGGGKVASKGMEDVALIKLNAVGGFAYAVTFGGAGLDTPGRVATDSAGNVYVTGAFTGSTTIGGTKLQAAGDSDALLASFTPAGELRWAHALGASQVGAAVAIAVDEADRVYVGGSFRGQMSLGPTPFKSATGSGDAFLAGYDTKGVVSWARSFGSVAEDGVIALAAKGDRLVATGELGGQTEIDGQSLAAHADGFVATFDPGGHLVWAQIFGSDDGLDTGTAIDLGPDGDIFLGGAIDRGPAPGGKRIDAGGIRSPFLAVLDSKGAPLWLKQFESSSQADVTGVAASPDGAAYFAGWFNDKLESAGGESYKSGGAEDMLLLRISPP